jgi:hypothetical protein
MKKLILTLTLLAVLLALPMAALANQGQPSISTLTSRGWQCHDIAGAFHCFDPGDANSNNASSMNVMVFSYAGKFLGTEMLWSAQTYGGQPCPQDFLIDLGAFVACHRYAQ